MKIKATPGERVFQACNYVFLTLLAFVCLYPMWHVLMASFSDSDALIAHSGLLLLPVELSPDAYQRVLSNHLVWIGYWNTLKLLVLGVSWQMVMTTLGAYVLSRREFMLRRPIMLAITFLFAAQCVGADTSLATLLRVILISLILTTGAGGVPGGGIVSIAIVVDAFGLPLEVVALVSGIFTLIDVVFTTMNCLGDLVGTVIVDRSEKKRTTRLEGHSEN